MTTPTVADPGLDIPVFLSPNKGGFKSVLEGVKGGDAVDADAARQVMANVEPVFDEAVAARAVAEQAMTKVKDHEARTAALELQIADQVKATDQAKKSAEFTRLGEEFTKLAGDGVTITSVYSSEKFAGLRDTQVEGVAFPITYGDAISRAISAQDFKGAAKLTKVISDKMSDNYSAGAASPSSTAAPAQAAAPASNYQSELASLNKKFAFRKGPNAFAERTQAFKDLKVKWGLN